MKVKWLEDAVYDLQSLRRYIAEDNPTAAHRVVKRILHSVQLLSEQPAMGRVGRVTHTRELVIPGTPYIIPYRVKSSMIEILRIFHSAMEWPVEI